MVGAYVVTTYTVFRYVPRLRVRGRVPATVIGREPSDRCPGIDEAPGAIAQGALAQRCYPTTRGRTAVSAPEPSAYPAPSLLLVIDPTARRTDGESVRIARDVLAAGAEVKVCLPETPEEYADAVRRAGRRRVVVVGDEAALIRAVGTLYRGRLLGVGGGPGSERPGDEGSGGPGLRGEGLGGQGSGSQGSLGEGAGGGGSRGAGSRGGGTRGEGSPGTGTRGEDSPGADSRGEGSPGAGTRGEGLRGGGLPAEGSGDGEWEASGSQARGSQGDRPRPQGPGAGGLRAGGFRGADLPGEGLPGEGLPGEGAG
ncbi:hypothetical protein GA0115257_12131, partial [Streptomyces sp. LcepLS]